MTDGDQPDKWAALHNADAQYALIKQALHEAQEAVEQALHWAKQLDPDADTTLHLTILDIDHAIADIAAETHDLVTAIGCQQAVIDNLRLQRDEAYRQRDAILRVARSRPKRKL